MDNSTKEYCHKWKKDFWKRNMYEHFREHIFWWISLAFAIASGCLIFSATVLTCIHLNPVYLILCFLGLGMALGSGFFALANIGSG